MYLSLVITTTFNLLQQQYKEALKKGTENSFCNFYDEIVRELCIVWDEHHIVTQDYYKFWI